MPINQNRRSPLTTLEMALQLQDLQRRQQMGPTQDLMKYRELLPHLMQLPDDEARQAEELYLGNSRADRGQAGAVRGEYMKGLTSDTLSDLETLQAHFEQQQQGLLSRLAKLAENPNVDYQSIFAQEGMGLGQRRQRALQDFAMKHRGAMNDPSVKSAFEQAMSLYGQQGTGYDFAQSMMRGATGVAPQPGPAGQTQMGNAIMGETQKRLPLYQALQGIPGQP